MDQPQSDEVREASGAARVESLSLAAPAYNEGEGIEEVVSQWVAYLRDVSGIREFEVVICNDGSRDDTGAILDRIASTTPELKPVHLARNQGAGAALATAIANTSKDWVLLIDSDGQFPIANLPRMIEAVETKKARCAIGIRAKKDTLFSRFGSWSSGLVCNLIHGTSYKDFNSAFKLVEGSLLRSFHLEGRGLIYSTEITSQLLERGVRMEEVDIDHQARTSGKSSLKLVRDSYNRLLFVFYIGVRKFLLWSGVLRIDSR